MKRPMSGGGERVTRGDTARNTGQSEWFVRGLLVANAVNMRTSTAFLAILLPLAAACSSSSSHPTDDTTVDAKAASPDASTGDDASTGNDAGISSDDLDTAMTGGHEAIASQEVSVLANDLFDFDPTIVPGDSPAKNAANIASHVTSLAGSCAKVTVTGAEVTVAFGSPPGCTLSNGDTVSGTVAVAVSEAGGTTTLALTLTSVVIDGSSLAGTASFATSSGSSFQVTLDVTAGSDTYTGDLTVAGESGSFTVSGTAKETVSGATSSYTLDDVVITPGHCYASAGSVTVVKGASTETITFESTTPTTGVAELTVGKHTVPFTLPTYGDCGAGAHDAGR